MCVSFLMGASKYLLKVLNPARSTICLSNEEAWELYGLKSNHTVGGSVQT